MRSATSKFLTGTLHYINRRLSGLRTVMSKNIFGHWCRRYITLNYITLHYIILH